MVWHLIMALMDALVKPRPPGDEIFLRLQKNLPRQTHETVTHTTKGKEVVK
jgi:hypothetical protein